MPDRCSRARRSDFSAETGAQQGRRTLDLPKIVWIRHVDTRVNQCRPNGFYRATEPPHPMKPRHHPDMEVMRGVFVVEIVHTLDAESRSLRPSNL